MAPVLVLNCPSCAARIRARNRGTVSKSCCFFIDLPWHSGCTWTIVDVRWSYRTMALIGRAWDPASISALAAIFGSLAGALGSAVSAWIVQKHQGRRDLLAKKIFHREQLYSEFISESAKVIVDAAQHTFQDPSRLIPTYALLSCIRLSSSMNVVESAERVVKTALDVYSEPNLTPEQIKSKLGKGDDPLRDFSNICRRDLESLWASAARLSEPLPRGPETQGA